MIMMMATALEAHHHFNSDYNHYRYSHYSAALLACHGCTLHLVLAKLPFEGANAQRVLPTQERASDWSSSPHCPRPEVGNAPQIGKTTGRRGLSGHSRGDVFVIRSCCASHATGTTTIDL